MVQPFLFPSSRRRRCKRAIKRIQRRNRQNEKDLKKLRRRKVITDRNKKSGWYFRKESQKRIFTMNRSMLPRRGRESYSRSLWSTVISNSLTKYGPIKQIELIGQSWISTYRRAYLAMRYLRTASIIAEKAQRANRRTFRLPLSRRNRSVQLNIKW